MEGIRMLTGQHEQAAVNDSFLLDAPGGSVGGEAPSEVGKFYSFEEMEPEQEGHNMVTSIHHFLAKRRHEFPGNVGVRIVEIPPYGMIPGHSHDGDDFASIIVCLSGGGVHWVSTGGKRVAHVVKPMAATLHRVRTDDVSLDVDCRHGFEAGKDGMTLLCVYNVTPTSDEKLKAIEEGQFEIAQDRDQRVEMIRAGELPRSCLSG
jgi:hypothetical protein